MGCNSSTDRSRRGSKAHHFSALNELADGSDAFPFGSDAMTILLVFPAGDTEGELFAEAGRILGSVCDTASSAEKALELFINQQHDVLVIDDRPHNAAFEAEGLVKSLRAITHSSFSTFVAVTSDCSLDEHGLQLLQQKGFDKRFKEANSLDSCYEELLWLQRSCFHYQRRLATLAAVFTALDLCPDAIEITDDRFRVQYVNSAHERQLGFTSNELVGKVSFDALKPDLSENEVKELSRRLRRGKECDSISNCRRKSGANSEQRERFIPVRGRKGRVEQFVCIRSPVSKERDQQSQGMYSRLNSKEQQQQGDSHGQPLLQFCASSLHSGPAKDAAYNRLNSITVEAPIHKVISLIHSAQENSSAAVVSTLDRVLDILQQPSELYSSELNASVDDKVTTGYMDGLMLTTNKQRERRRPTVGGQQSRHNSTSTMNSLTEIPESIVRVLENEDEWSFDILELERITNKKPMVYLAMRTLRRFNVCQFLRCSEETMLRWLEVIQDHYHADNPYHNATHGADVMQSSAYFLERDRIKSVFDDMDEVASLLGALVHDLDHPGRTNPFLINSQDKLAMLYNDITVLENHHVSLAFRLTLQDDRINIFKNMSREDFKTLRQSMIDIVLATEMAKHFEHVGKFSTQIVAPLLFKEAEEGAERITEEEAVEMLTKPENRVLIKRVLIKCSDVSNPCRSLQLCKQWARRISEEYFQQTDDEKNLGLPIVMPVFDRLTCNMPQSQTSFIDFFLREMFTVWHKFCNVPELLENLNNNYAYWKQLVNEAKRVDDAATGNTTAATATAAGNDDHHDDGGDDCEVRAEDGDAATAAAGDDDGGVNHQEVASSNDKNSNDGANNH